LTGTHLHHTGLTVRDLPRSLAFWRDALGMEVVLDQETEGTYLGAIIGSQGAQARAVQLRFPGQSVRIELHRYAHPQGGRRHAAPPDAGFAHVAVVCTELDGCLGRLVSAGGQPYGPPVTIDAGANAGARAVYVRDPDGHTLELLEPAAGR
jgi:catechol 2,3-dioxygenase-like lactoylglutathione lyase family enzyme